MTGLCLRQGLALQWQIIASCSHEGWLTGFVTLTICLVSLNRSIFYILIYTSLGIISFYFLKIFPLFVLLKYRFLLIMSFTQKLKVKIIIPLHKGGTDVALQIEFLSRLIRAYSSLRKQTSCTQKHARECALLQLTHKRGTDQYSLLRTHYGHTKPPNKSLEKINIGYF